MCVHACAFLSACACAYTYEFLYMSVCLYRYVHAVVARVRFVCVRLHEINENVCIRWYMYRHYIPRNPGAYSTVL